MQLLKIEDNRGYYLSQDGEWREIDHITKDSLLWILEQVLTGEAQFDEYNEDMLKNQAHQVIYKSIYTNLKALSSRKDEFLDESERLFLEDYKRYVEEPNQSAAGADGDYDLDVSR